MTKSIRDWNSKDQKDFFTFFLQFGEFHTEKEKAETLKFLNDDISLTELLINLKRLENA